MANSTIGNLPAGTTISGSELIPMVQGGITVAIPASALQSSVAGPVFTSPVTIHPNTAGNGWLLKGLNSSNDTLQARLPNAGYAYLSATGPVTTLGLVFETNALGGFVTQALRLEGNGDATVGANLYCSTSGKGLRVREGANCKQGVATLIAGAVVVANTSVTASSRIFLTVQSLGTVAAPKAIAVTARTAGTSFTITSADATDTSVVAWEIFEPG